MWFDGKKEGNCYGVDKHFQDHTRLDSANLIIIERFRVVARNDGNIQPG
ncbi:MAG: hypothetical protein JWO44_1998 [Bacteroidetes bacterium]|nr:hypothetical protein [Bacteroidota bacterium]